MFEDCIRCSEAPAVDELGYAAIRHWAVQAEIEGGLLPAARVLGSWARFSDWCDAHGLSTRVVQGRHSRRLKSSSALRRVVEARTPRSERPRRASPTRRHGPSPGAGRPRKPATPAAIACAHVSSLPRSRAAITMPRSIAACRSPVIDASRTTIVAIIHPGTTCTAHEHHHRPEGTSTLSAIGVEQRAEWRRASVPPRELPVEEVGRHREAKDGGRRVRRDRGSPRRPGRPRSGPTGARATVNSVGWGTSRGARIRLAHVRQGSGRQPRERLRIRVFPHSSRARAWFGRSLFGGRSLCAPCLLPRMRPT